MKKQFSIQLALICLCSSLHMGCDPEDREGRDGSLCTDLCAKLEMCDSFTDESDCVEYCQADRAFSVAYWTSYSLCVEESSCNQLSDSDNLLDCVVDEINQYHYSTDTGKDACRHFATVLETCDENFDEATVYDSCIKVNAAFFSDQLLSDLQNCFSDSCDVIASCVIRTFDDYDVDGLEESFFAGLGMGQGPGPDNGSCSYDSDCGYGEHCDRVTNRCLPLETSDGSCETNDDCGPGLFCDVWENTCLPEHVCSRWGDLIYEEWDYYCEREDCCFCRCWNQGRIPMDFEVSLDSGLCACRPDQIWAWDGYPSCSGDSRESAMQCFEDADLCRYEWQDMAEMACGLM